MTWEWKTELLTTRAGRLLSTCLRFDGEREMRNGEKNEALTNIIRECRMNNFDTDIHERLNKP